MAEGASPLDDAGDRSERSRPTAGPGSTGRAHPDIPGYRIEGIVARGASGTVYRARQVAVQREVALKVLHVDHAGKKQVVRRLQREARTAARLAHPHIVSAIDMGETDGLWWFAMELVDGPSLALRLRQAGHLSEREALRLFIPLCQALVHLWEHGIVHRDVKPANILIDDAGPRLADLGLAFAEGDPVLTAQGVTLGTPHYISPEQARDPSAVDARADLWSFGATMFHTLCGEPPFVGESLAEVLSGVLHAPIPDPRDLRPEMSRGMALILRKCLSRDVLLRYQNARELLGDLELVRERRAPQINVRALEPVHREPNLLLRGLGVVLGVAALALFTWFALSRGDDRRQIGDEGAPMTIDVEDDVRRLVESAQHDRTYLAAALAELRVYRASAPESLSSRLRAMESSLAAQLRSELRALREHHEARLSELIAEGDLIGAERALDSEFEEALKRRTGFTFATLPEDAARLDRVWVVERKADVARATEAAALVVGRAVDGHYERVVMPAVDRDQAAGRWRTAMIRLSGVPEDLLEEAGVETDGLPSAEVVEALAPLRSRLSVRRAALVDAWTRVDAELVRWVSRRADTLEEGLESRRLRAGAAEELHTAFERKLENDLLDRAEFLDPESCATLRELERRASALDDLEEDLLAADYEEQFRVLGEVFRSHWTTRDYGTLLAVWTDFERELAGLPGDSTRSWRKRLERRVAALVREAELLSDLLRRAAERVEERNGEELELSLGHIRIRGRVAVVGDPLSTPFQLHAPQTTHDVRLVELETRDLIALSEPRFDADEPEKRLVRALLQSRDGRAQESLETLRSGKLPDDDVPGRLALDLKDRAIGELEVARDVQAERLRAAEGLLELIDSDRPGTYQLSTVTRLLEDFGDLRVVRDRARELREIRDRLSAPRPRPEEADFRAAFDPRAVEIGKDHVRLIFEFDADGGGVWEPGSWRADGEGWSATETATGFALATGPRLSLRQPRAEVLASNELRVRVDVEELSPACLLVISAAGFHVSIAGDGLPIDGKRGLLVTSGSLGDHLDQVRRGKAATPTLLRRGAEHRIELVLRRRSGRVTLRFDGREIETVTVRPPRESPALHSVELRSWEILRLLRVEVAGDRPQ